MLHIMGRRFSDDKHRDGEGVVGRLATQDLGGIRRKVREPAGVGGTVLRELRLCAEDFLATAADGADRAGEAAARLAEPGDGGGGSAFAPPVAGVAGPDRRHGQPEGAQSPGSARTHRSGGSKTAVLASLLARLQPHRTILGEDSALSRPASWTRCRRRSPRPFSPSHPETP